MSTLAYNERAERYQSLEGRQQRRGRELLRVAYHEAGHAVAAIVENRSFRSVTIVPTEDALGSCSASRWPRNSNPEYSTDLLTLKRLESDIIVFLAGHIAEKHFSGRNNWVGSSHDRRAAADYASYLVGSDEELAAYQEWLWIRTEGLVRVYQQEIATLATSLLTEKTIQGKRAREIFLTTQRSKFGIQSATLDVKPLKIREGQPDD